MSDGRREIVHGLDLDVRILAGELYGRPGADVETAVRAIDRMLADLRRLREQLAGEPGTTEAGQ